MSEEQIKGDELISKAREIIQELIDTGARSWSLHIPARVNEDPDLILSRVITDFESERALRIDAEKKLHELQDAIVDLENAHQQDKTCSPRNWKIMLDAIEESSKRREGK